MQSNLSTLCHDARARIDVPTVPLDAIRDGAQRSPFGSRRSSWRSWVAAILAAGSIAAIAAGAATWYGTHVTLTRSGAVLITADQVTAKFRNASSADVRAAVRGVDFPVILPAGLPAGSRLISVFRAGPGAIVLGYALPGAWRASHHLAYILLTNPSIVSRSSAGRTGKLSIRTAAVGPAIRWRIGVEDVIVSNNNFTPSELARIEAAMLASARK